MEVTEHGVGVIPRLQDSSAKIAWRDRVRWLSAASHLAEAGANPLGDVGNIRKVGGQLVDIGLGRVGVSNGLNLAFEALHFRGQRTEGLLAFGQTGAI